MAAWATANNSGAAAMSRALASSSSGVRSRSPRITTYQKRVSARTISPSRVPRETYHGKGVCSTGGMLFVLSAVHVAPKIGDALTPEIAVLSRAQKTVALGSVDAAQHSFLSERVEHFDGSAVRLGNAEGLGYQFHVAFEFHDGVEPDLAARARRESGIGSGLETVVRPDSALAGAFVGGFQIDDPAVDVEQIHDAAHLDAGDDARNRQFDGGRFDQRRGLIEIFHGERRAHGFQFRAVFGGVELRPGFFLRPGVVIDGEHAFAREILFRLDLLREVFPHRAMQRFADGKRRSLRIGKLEAIAVPEFRSAREIRIDARRRKNIGQAGIRRRG